MIKPVGTTELKWYDIEITPVAVTQTYHPQSSMNNFYNTYYHCLMVFVDKDQFTGKIYDREIYAVNYCEKLGGWLYSKDNKPYPERYFKENIMSMWCFIPYEEEIERC